MLMGYMSQDFRGHMEASLNTSVRCTGATRGRRPSGP